MDQGNCGSCWSFAVANSVGDAQSINAAKAEGKKSCDKQVNLSEEELLWCSTAISESNNKENCGGGVTHLGLEQVARNGLGTEKCNPQGHGGGEDSLEYGGCPIECKGEGDMDNKVFTEGYNPDCSDTNRGATDEEGQDCSWYNENPEKCAKQDTNAFKAYEMCCACKSEHASNVNFFTSTAEIQSWLVNYGPVVVSMPVYKHFQGTETNVQYPKEDQEWSGRHAVECLGWGHDENGDGFWIMKNSWGCNWGDSGFFKQSWQWNDETAFYMLKLDGSSDFQNDIPVEEEHECKVPEDSNNGDHCAQYSEFGTCKLCNSGYQLSNDGSCSLQNEQIENLGEYVISSDNETMSEDLFWKECEVNGNQGFVCPTDSPQYCYALNSGDEVQCSTWLDLFQTSGMSSDCSMCPALDIANCATQSGSECIECAEGQTLSEMRDLCLLTDCPSDMEANVDNECVVPEPNCESGHTLTTSNCQLCKPGFVLKLGKCQELPDPLNCAEIEMSNPEKTCNVCVEGQYVDQNGKCTGTESSEDLSICEDTDDGEQDLQGFKCSDYNEHPDWCGTGETATFTSIDMCCACLPFKLKDAKQLKDKLARCEGNCDVDSDCQSGLKCFKRSSSEDQVPGCLAGGNEDFDTYNYCQSAEQYGKQLVKVASNPDVKLDACEGDCDDDSECKSGLKCFQRSSSEDQVPGCAIGGIGDVAKDDQCQSEEEQGIQLKKIQDQRKLGQCEGHCSDDEDCVEGLTCQERKTSEDQVPGCAIGGKADKPSRDFCQSEEKQGTLLRYYGSEPDTSVNKLGLCEGDCDEDIDCEPGLICYQRDSSDDQVPGCVMGGDGDRYNVDQCYKVEEY